MNTYYTMDYNDDRIEINASFMTREEAENSVDFSSEPGDFVVTGWTEGEFGDCWIKMYSKPSQEDLEYIAKNDGIDIDDLTVRPPGTHPGGNAWWIGINATLMVPQWAEVQ